jgi:hypothetical protein
MRAEIWTPDSRKRSGRAKYLIVTVCQMRCCRRRKSITCKESDKVALRYGNVSICFGFMQFKQSQSPSLSRLAKNVCDRARRSGRERKIGQREITYLRTAIRCSVESGAYVRAVLEVHWCTEVLTKCRAVGALQEQVTLCSMAVWNSSLQYLQTQSPSHRNTTSWLILTAVVLRIRTNTWVLCVGRLWRFWVLKLV